ncbi:MAG: hypothetical protein AAF705_03280 [Bacteroidota bacterium]
MNKLKIADFKSARLPKMAELNVTGGIACSDLDDVGWDLINNNQMAQFANICGRDLQCTGGPSPTGQIDCNLGNNNQP